MWPFKKKALRKEPEYEEYVVKRTICTAIITHSNGIIHTKTHNKFTDYLPSLNEYQLRYEDSQGQLRHYFEMNSLYETDQNVFIPRCNCSSIVFKNSEVEMKDWRIKDGK